MKNNLLIIVLIFIFWSLDSEEYFDLNFFIEPNFEPVDANMVNFLIQNIKNDSIDQFNVFAGRTLKQAVPDSITLQFINFIQPNLVSPLDFHFYDFDVTFNLLMSNVKCDSVPILDRYIVETDSMRIGFLSIYTPDWTVKNNLPEYVKFDFKFFELTKQIAHELEPETDFIILLSNLSKFIDADLIKDLPINVVISFDYQKKRNEKLNNGKSSFYSILTSREKYGKIRLTYHNGAIFYDWREMEFKVKP